ncbi:MAG: hypothetical protein HUK20_06350 [Fibrobacter sp.]|nr:hypothetical protein [Fibrobacter sp.]
MKRALFASIALSLMMMACSVTTERTLMNEDKMNHKLKEDIRIYGVERGNVIGPVFWASKTKCSKIDFYMHVVSQNKDVDALVDVNMEESAFAQMGADSTFFCKYSALAVSYSSIDVEEAAKWGKILNPPSCEKDSSKANDSVAVVTPAVEQAAPVAPVAPAASVAPAPVAAPVYPAYAPVEAPVYQTQPPQTTVDPNAAPVADPMHR